MSKKANIAQPEYRKAKLSPEQSCYVDKQLADEGQAYLQVQLEVLEIGAGCQALIWVWNNQDHHKGTLGHCKLTSAQWAECMLHLEQGSRPVYSVRWQVFGRLQDGCHCIGQGKVVEMHHLPQPRWGELSDMVGLAY